MGNCLQKPREFIGEYLRRRARLTITLLLVGLDDSGKSMVLKRLRNDRDNNVVPTIGFRHDKLESEHFKVIINELGGSSQIRSIWPKYYSDVFGVIYVVDASNRLRLGENKAVFHELITHENIAGKPVLLLGNKQDLINAVDELDMVETLEVEQIVNRMRCPTRVETCSSMLSLESDENNLLGILNGYKWLIDTIYKNYTYLNSRIMLAEKLSMRRRSSLASGITYSETSTASGSAKKKSESDLTKALNKMFLPKNKTAPLSSRVLSPNSNVGPIPICRSSSNAEEFLDRSFEHRKKVKGNASDNRDRPKTAPHAVENNFILDL